MLAPKATEGVLLDLLMAVMNSLDAWAAAAGDRARGLAWRDAVTARMRAAGSYVLYEDLVRSAAGQLGLAPSSSERLLSEWQGMQPWPDAAAIATLAIPYAFVTNCSTTLAAIAAGRSGVQPRFVLTAEEAGYYKPDPRIYIEGCRRLGTAPGRTLFVAGAAYDADGAAVAGLRAFLVARRREVTPPGSRVVVLASLDEFVARLQAAAV